MGATVLVNGPTDFGTAVTAQAAERMLTDAHGRFTLAHLLPGWYSLNVSSPTRHSRHAQRRSCGSRNDYQSLPSF